VGFSPGLLRPLCAHTERTDDKKIMKSAADFIELKDFLVSLDYKTKRKYAFAAPGERK
jgi:hypothetical protein